MTEQRAVTAGHQLEVERGERFTFGANWARFLALVDEERIASAEESLREMLEVDDLKGRRFIDVGSGSGLFSLAARRLGATVHSFDYDPQSVACTRELRRRYFPDDSGWRVDEASVLDPAYLATLGQFDIVYSWGVLHHTGAMWRALDNVVPLVADGGRLFVALYNDDGGASRRWTTIKKIYNRLPDPLKGAFTVLVFAPIEIRYFLVHLVRFRLGEYFAQFRRYKRGRGMSRIRDMIDWIGGYPFEVSKPGEVFDFYRARGFTLARLKTGEACNEFVFDKNS